MTEVRKSRDIGKTGTAVRQPVIHFDLQDWLPFVADMKATDAEKREYIETLFTIVLGFVDLGFDITAQAETCGESFDLATALLADVVPSSTQSKPPFVRATNNHSTPAEKGDQS